MRLLLILLMLSSLMGCASEEERRKFEIHTREMNEFVGREIKVNTKTFEIMEYYNGMEKFKLSNGDYVNEVYVTNKLKDKEEIVIDEMNY